MRRLVLLSCALALVILTVAGWAWGDYLREQDRRLIILNSHNDHLVGMGMDCQMCHTAAADSRVSSDRIFPDKKEGCAPCHDVESEDQCVLCHATGMPREFFANPRREIAFNHALHTGDLALDCRHCHRGMDGVMYSQDNPTALPMMASCMDCHDDTAAPMAFESCHLNTQNLRPEFHTTTFLADHRRMARTGVFPENQDCTMCHKDNWCQECHDEVRLVGVHSPLMDRYATGAPQQQGRQTQIVQRVHGLNYRFVHQLDARGKERDCMICHEPTESCADCHRPGDARFMPVWHQGADWAPSRITGGRHADWARRDLERCIGCHDTFDGQDPVCARCHEDRRR